jgi:hypothetical protein
MECSARFDPFLTSLDFATVIFLYRAWSSALRPTPPGGKTQHMWTVTDSTVIPEASCFFQNKESRLLTGLLHYLILAIGFYRESSDPNTYHCKPISSRSPS